MEIDQVEFANRVRAWLRVTPLVVTFNSSHCLSGLANGIRDATNLIVVDNASTDSSCDAVSRELPQATLIRLDSNRGFGAANNAGLAHVVTEFVLLLNPDCIVDWKSIEMLVSTMDQTPEASCAAPSLIDRHGRRKSPGSRRIPRSPSDRSNMLEYITACGACMLIRTKAMRTVGGFDETFFLYYEDDDLCIRLQRDAGALVFVPDAEVHHHSRGSVGGSALFQAEKLRGYHHIRSKFKFNEKYFGSPPNFFDLVRYAISSFVELLFRLISIDTKRACRSYGRLMGVIDAGAWNGTR